MTDPKDDEVDAPSEDIADQISQLRFEGKLKSANTSARTDDGERKPPATPISPATLLSSSSLAEDDNTAVRSINFDACDAAVAVPSPSPLSGSSYDKQSSDFDKPQISEHDQVSSSSNPSTSLPAVDLPQSPAAPLLVDSQSNIRMLRRRLIGGERISSTSAYASSSSSSSLDVGVSTAVADTTSISSTTIPAPAPAPAVPVVDAAPQPQREAQIMNLQQLPEDSVDHLLKAILMVLAYFVLFLFYKQFTLLQGNDFHMN